MARVITIAQSVRDLTGGLDRFEIDAPTVRALVATLDARYPGFDALVRDTMFIAIDGELHHQAWGEPLTPETEVVFVPMIAGG